MSKTCKEFKREYGVNVECCAPCHILSVEDNTAKNMFLRPDPKSGPYLVCCEVARAYDAQVMEACDD